MYKRQASDSDGVQRGSTWQCCPGTLVYRRDVYKRQLMPEQYDQEGKASLKIEFAGRKFSIHIFNREKKEWNKVQIKEAFCDGTLLSAEGGRQARLQRSEIEKLT